MGEVLLVRHGQASYGAADYDQLSGLGRRQAAALGRSLAGLGLSPDAWFMGTLKRHRQTMDEAAAPFAEVVPNVHDGLDEFDGGALIRAHRLIDANEFRAMLGDRLVFFRALREATLAWQRDEVDNPPELFSAFRERVALARLALVQPGRTVVAVTSGGPIALMVTEILRAPMEAMPSLQMQIKNASVTRLRVIGANARLSTFNEMPHIAHAHAANLESYS